MPLNPLLKSLREEIYTRDYDTIPWTSLRTCVSTLDVYTKPNASYFYRHPISRGAFPFSTRDHGWPISDCTSEGVKAAMAIEQQVFADIQVDNNGNGIYHNENGDQI